MKGQKLVVHLGVQAELELGSLEAFYTHGFFLSDEQEARGDA